MIKSIKSIALLIQIIVICPGLLIGQNSFPANGTTLLNANSDQNLILKDGRSGINWNYIEWQFSNGARDWVLGRAITTGYFTVWRHGANEVLTIDNAGKVGIGTTSPRGKFDIDGPGDIYLNDDPVNGVGQSIYLPGHIFISPHTNASGIAFLQARRSDNSGSTSLRIRTWNSGSLTDAMHIEGNGNIGVGTNSPGSYKLAVEGKIGAREVNVTTGVWSDYVFNKDYKLRSLTEVQQYIEENHHLPEVPSEKEVFANGQNLGEMNAILLRKIEEMTLYLIDQNKKMAQLEQESRASADASAKKIEELTLYVIEANRKIEVLQDEVSNLKKKK